MTLELLYVTDIKYLLLPQKPYNDLLIHYDVDDDITMETLENQITLETLDHLIINAIKEIRYSKKKRPDENSIFEYLNKQYMESRLSSMIVDGKLEKKCTNGQTSFYIKKLENELSCKTDASILTQKSPSAIICRTPSHLTFGENEYHKMK